ncbi:hypothetical protein COLO4_05195 [Corchorus olitorius]|uniref:Uncharacterized protein n=1 Tax=Corchorus olitorius TaxID=93759 RepID=A0A1R3KRK0_9ROSI|nr:hypothetical protein COLO4_05195 [Corchorus olitorius]
MKKLLGFMPPWGSVRSPGLGKKPIYLLGGLYCTKMSLVHANIHLLADVASFLYLDCVPDVCT